MGPFIWWVDKRPYRLGFGLVDGRLRFQILTVHAPLLFSGQPRMIFFFNICENFNI